MANTVIFTGTLQWTPPAAPTNSGQSSFSVQASYNAHNVGSLDIPSGTAPATEIQIPFGQVNEARFMVVKNLMTTDVDLKLNGSVDLITLPPQGQHMWICPVDLTDGANPLTEASITVLTSPTVVQNILFWVYGD
jgi:pectate lyase